MEQRDTISDTDKKLIVEMMAVEYEMLSAEIRQDLHSCLLWISAVAVGSGAVVYAAFGFGNWDKPLVPNILLSIALPLLLAFGMLLCAKILHPPLIRRRYLAKVLEPRANRLLGASLELWLANAREASEKSTASKDNWKALRHQVLGWHSWQASEHFHDLHKRELKLARKFLWGCVLLLFVIPAALAWARVLLTYGGVGQESIFQVLPLMLLVTPIAIGAAVCVALIIAERAVTTTDQRLAGRP